MQTQQGDYLIKQLRQREKAEEDRFFAERDRRLIEQLQHRQSAGAQEQPTDTPSH